MNTTHFVHVLLYERWVGCPTESLAKPRPPCSNEFRSALCLSVNYIRQTLSTQQLLTGCQDMYVFRNSVNGSIGITQLEELQ